MIDTFGLLAPLYDRVVKFVDRQKIVSVAELPVRGRLMDAAGGTGRIAERLCDLAGQVVVVDISPGMLLQASEKRLETCCSQTEQMPFPAESFDRIIMVDALHHVIDQSRTVLELWRLLRVGGKVIIIEPDIRSSVIKLLTVLEKVLLMRSHILPYTKIISLFPENKKVSYIGQEELSVWLAIEKVR